MSFADWLLDVAWGFFTANIDVNGLLFPTNLLVFVVELLQFHFMKEYSLWVNKIKSAGVYSSIEIDFGGNTFLLPDFFDFWSTEWSIRVKNFIIIYNVVKFN